ncbi:MAG TPA: ABC transporter substrate-binding protein [Acetobacteraceae bacterium]|nr:ABC transporter substrate-binding protein [Acetobacteraceae bacterium]
MNTTSDAGLPARVRRRRFLAGSAASALAMSGPREARAAGKGGTVVVAHTTLAHLNPAIQSGNATGIPGAQIFSSLVRLDANWQVKPYLATEWTTSADNLTHTFRLHDKAVFHDGKPVTAEDVAFSVDVVRANHPFGKTMFGPVSEVQTPDSKTVVFRLAQPIPALLVMCSSMTLPILPKHVFGTGDIRRNPANVAPIGSGPFKFVSYARDQQIELERFEEFGAIYPNRPMLDRLVFRIITDPMVTMLALSRGECHYGPFAGVLVRNIAGLRSNPRIAITDKGYEAFGPTNYLEFNQRKPPLGDVRVRRAIYHAIDRNFIVDKLLMQQTRRLDGPFYHASPFFDASALHQYDYDLATANKLLDEAGLPRKAGGMRFALTLDWIPDANVNSQAPVAQFLKPQLAKVGIDITLRASPDFATWASRVSNWEHELSMNGIWNWPDPVIGVHRAYLCSNQHQGVIWSNTEGYCNQQLDAVMAAAARETDLAKRKALYRTFQQITTSDVPFAWTNEEPLFTIYDVKLDGLPLSVWGAMAPFDEMRWKA